MNFRDFVKTIVYRGLEQIGKFYSVYRGYVIDNNDPDNMGRLKIQIPQVTRDKTHTKWVWARNNYSGKNYGSQILPQIGDLVWVEFEQGNTEFPVWSHGHYGKDEKPNEFSSPNIYGFKTPNGQVFVFDDRLNEVYTKLKRCDGSEKEYNTVLAAFNHGNNGGLVNVIELTCRLNAIEEKINAILVHYDSHVHIDPLSGYTGPPSPPLAGSDSITPRPGNIDLTDQDEIEDEKVLH
jgi:hypothetical protein